MSETDQNNLPDEPSGEGVYLAPWEKSFERIISPIEEFTHRQTTTGLLLIVTTVIALALANSPLAPYYQGARNVYGGVSLGSWELKMSLLHWINDGLMAFFFFIVGLELKREITVGELARPRQAALPIACAIGGMVLPALVYAAINMGGAGTRGWGVPMATDIAFAIGIMVLLADRVPKALLTFLVALAIVDDLGAVLVIALFYTETLHLQWLLAAVAVLCALGFFNMTGVQEIVPYFLLAMVLWYALYRSGIHASLAGVLGAFTVPSKPKYDPPLFSRRVRDLLGRFDSSYSKNPNILLNTKLSSVVSTLEDGIQKVQPPLQRLEHIWHLPVAFLVIPVFALFNAGVAVNASTLTEAFSSRVALGVLAGLVLGKFFGITGVAWLMLKLDLAQLPRDTRFSQIAGVSLLAGIGFTMAIFIAELGFVNSNNLFMAKMGILVASLVAGVGGYTWLYLCAENPKPTAESGQQPVM